LAYIFVAEIIQISAVGFKRRIFLQQSVLAIQGHPRSMILVPIEVRIWLPISPSCWLWSYLAPFL